MLIYFKNPYQLIIGVLIGQRSAGHENTDVNLSNI
jgi:hypothetical protein